MMIWVLIIVLILYDAYVIYRILETEKKKDE